MRELRFQPCRPICSAVVLAALLACATGLRTQNPPKEAAPREALLTCSPNLSGERRSSPPPRPVPAATQAPAARGEAGRGGGGKRVKRKDLCSGRRWVEQVANCNISEGPEKFVAKYAGFWNNSWEQMLRTKPVTGPCPVSTESLARSARPRGFEGARLRVRRAVDRMRRGENISIVVIGTSMALGTNSQRSWPSRMQDHINRLELPATVTNLAKGGTTSEYAIATFGDMKAQLKTADIILVDYGINDRENSQKGGVVAIRKNYMNLVKLLISLPNQPGIVDLQTFYETPISLDRASGEVGVRAGEGLGDELGERSGYEVPTNDCSKVDVTKFHHWSVNAELKVPMVSYTEAVCWSNRTWWMTEWTTEDSWGSPHPGAITHDLVARTALGFLFQELEHVCSKGVDGEDFDAAELEDHIQCLTEPTTAYNSTANQTSFNPSARELGWEFGADVVGKPQGWIARTGKPSMLGFKVWLARGWIQMEYLGTYENIGSVDVWLDHKLPAEGNACEVSGLWADHSSQSKFTLFKAEVTGEHVIYFRSAGDKFKLLSLRAC